jgi:hypothetical protein
MGLTMGVDLDVDEGVDEDLDEGLQKVPFWRPCLKFDRFKTNLKGFRLVKEGSLFCNKRRYPPLLKAVVKVSPPFP